MNTKRFYLTIAALLTIISIIVIPAQAAGKTSKVDLVEDLVFYCVEDNYDTTFRITVARGNKYVLFLPAGADATAVQFAFPFPDSSHLVLKTETQSLSYSDSSIIDFDGLLNGKTSEKLTISLVDDSNKTIKSMKVTLAKSSSIDSVFLLSSNPIQYGREWVEKAKSNHAEGSLLIINESGEITHTGALEHIKGRGNSTWAWPKKPYQIKLSKKDDLLDTGDKKNKSKKWILLANYADSTLLSNQIALELGAGIGMDFNIEYKPVDLYYDGEYRGSYLLTEKVEIGSGRVDIYNLESENETVNDGVDLETLPVGQAYTENGACYSYCEGMINPDDFSGGYLLEMDLASRAKAEVCWIHTVNDHWITVKSPEYASREQMDYIATMYQTFENAVYHNGTDPDTGKLYSDIVDVNSIAQYYLISEISRNYDGFASSAYLYLDKGAEKMKMGPLWDYDLSFREFNPESVVYTVHGALANRLYRNQDFRSAVSNLYNEKMYPFIKNVLFAEEPIDNVFDSFNTSAARIEASRLGDILLWGENHQKTISNYTVEQMRRFIEKHSETMKEVYSTWVNNNDEYHVFIDVLGSEWFAQEIWRAEEAGLVHGESLLKFAPYKLATRAQTIEILYNMSQPTGIVPRQIFDDVAKTSWCGQSITWAYDTGIAKGATKNEFLPDVDISRQDIVVLLYRYYNEPASDESALSKYSDRNQISGYAVKAMAWAVENSVMNGKSENTLAPTDTATRAELTALLLRCYEKYGAN